MGPSFTYERISEDQQRYSELTDDGKYSDWWRAYLLDSGFPCEYRPISEIPHIVSATTVGILQLAPISRPSGHVVAIDDHGFINPSTGWPERIGTLRGLLDDFYRQGIEYRPENNFLAISRPPAA
jgi:hypothetical protein